MLAVLVSEAQNFHSVIQSFIPAVVVTKSPQYLGTRPYPSFQGSHSHGEENGERKLRGTEGLETRTEELLHPGVRPSRKNVTGNQKAQEKDTLVCTFEFR